MPGSARLIIRQLHPSVHVAHGIEIDLDLWISEFRVSAWFEQIENASVIAIFALRSDSLEEKRSAVLRHAHDLEAIFTGVRADCHLVRHRHSIITARIERCP